jgi:uncharacterized protein (DUF4415 family)
MGLASTQHSRPQRRQSIDIWGNPMDEPKKKGPGRGGRRKGAGRKPSGKGQLTVRIRTDIIEAFQPNAARRLSEWIEKRFKKP